MTTINIIYDLWIYGFIRNLLLGTSHKYNVAYAVWSQVLQFKYQSSILKVTRTKQFTGT